MKKLPSDKTKKKKETKKRVKKLTTLLNILIILSFSGFVFYQGWISFKIPEGERALIYTKTRGYENKLLKGGLFYWRWENLLPTNLSLHFIDLSSQSISIDLKGELPSGKLYSQITGDPKAFDYSIDLDVNIKLKEDRIPSLIKEQGGGFKDLRPLYNQASAQLKEKLETVIQEGADQSSLIKILKEGTQKDFYLVEDVKIKNFSIPDRKLYQMCKEKTIKQLSEKAESSHAKEIISINQNKQVDQKVEILEKYGNILTKYPILLQYLALDEKKIDQNLFESK